MAAFINACQTNGGKHIMTLGQAGKAIYFSRIVMGDGYLPEGQNLKEMTGLVNQRVSLPIPENGVQALGNGELLLRAPFSNAALDVGFFYRELGAFAIHPDTGEEVLYCCGNAGDDADWIPPTGGNTIIEKMIRIITLIGDATCVEATLKSGLVLTPEDLEAHNNDPDAHPNAGPNQYITTIAHEFGYTPMLCLYRTDHAFGTQPFGSGPFGGGPSRTVNAAYETGFGGQVDVYTTREFDEGPQTVRHTENQIAFLYDGKATNLLLKLH